MSSGFLETIFTDALVGIAQGLAVRQLGSVKYTKTEKVSDPYWKDRREKEAIKTVASLFLLLEKDGNWRGLVHSLGFLYKKYPDLEPTISREVIRQIEHLDLTKMVMGALKP